MPTEAGARWDTRDIAATHRYDAWQDILQRVYGAWDVDRPTGSGFDAQLTHRAVGGFQIVDCACDPCGARRTRAEIGVDGRESITVQLVLSGRETFAIGEKRVDLGPGDVLLWNSIRPMRFEVTERLRKISVTMPLARLRSWLPSEWHSIEGCLPRGSAGAGLLSSIVGSLSPSFLAGDLRHSEALTEAVLGILVNVLGIDREDGPTTLRETRLATVKDHIHANLGNPDLSPVLIAQAKRVSLRYLHALFEGEGTTVQQYIIRQRLIRCRRELENPKMAGRTITDIAYGWGFQNSPHFSRRFKAEFGVSPQAFRADLIAGADRPAARS